MTSKFVKQLIGLAEYKTYNMPDVRVIVDHYNQSGLVSVRVIIEKDARYSVDTIDDNDSVQLQLIIERIKAL